MNTLSILLTIVVENMHRYNEQGNVKLKNILKQGKYWAQASDRIVFQRFLGHFEILNGFRWHEVDIEECFICEKWSYSLFLWDKKLARNCYKSVKRSDFYRKYRLLK